MNPDQQTDLPQLTERQTKVLEFILDFWEKNMFPPSIQEISKELGINPNGAESHISSLVRKGAIRKTPKIARSIVPMEIVEHMESFRNETH